MKMKKMRLKDIRFRLVKKGEKGGVVADASLETFFLHACLRSEPPTPTIDAQLCFSSGIFDGFEFEFRFPEIAFSEVIKKRKDR
jgi:hypothetical protein